MLPSFSLLQNVEYSKAGTVIKTYLVYFTISNNILLLVENMSVRL